MAVTNTLVKNQNDEKKLPFSVAIQQPKWQALVNNTLGDPDRARRFVAAVSSAVAVNPTLQTCDAGSVLGAALLGESLNLSPSPSSGSITWCLTTRRRRRTGTATSFPPQKRWPSSRSATRA